MSLIEKIKPLKISGFSSYVIMAFIFSIPISTSVSDALAVFIVLLWTIEGNFKEKYEEIKKNKVTLAVLAYVLLHVVGLLWTSDYAWGLYTVKKQWKLMLLPVFLTSVKKKHLPHYLYAFIFSMFFSTIFSFLAWFKLIKLTNVSPDNPTPFVQHITYTPFLALAVYMTCYCCFYKKPQALWEKIFLPTASFLMSIDVFLTQGRAGHMAFFVLLVIFVIQYLSIKKLAVGIGISLLVATVTFTAFYNLTPFKERVDNTLAFVKENKFTASDLSIENSLAERLTYFLVTSKLIQDNQIIGVGTGDFPVEYIETRKKYYEFFGYARTENPHNQYLLVLAQFGLVGFFVFSSVFFQQLRASFHAKTTEKFIMVALPVFYLTIFLGDTYIQTSGSSLLFSAFSAVLYKKT